MLKYKLWYLKNRKLEDTLYNENKALDFSISMEIIEKEYSINLQSIINRNIEDKAWNIIKTLIELTNKENQSKIGYINKITSQVGNILFNEYIEKDKELIRKFYGMYTDNYIEKIKNKIQTMEHTINNLNEEIEIVQKLKSETLK